MNFQVNATQLESIGYALEADKRSIQNALNATLKKTVTLGRHQILDHIAKTTGVPKRNLSKRCFKSVRQQKGKIWVGLSNINILGLNPHQTATGVRFRGNHVDGAFITSKGIFKRMTKKAYPLEHVTFPIKKAGEDGIKAFLTRKLENFFFKEFERQMS